MNLFKNKPWWLSAHTHTHTRRRRKKKDLQKHVHDPVKQIDGEGRQVGFYVYKHQKKNITAS